LFPKLLKMTLNDSPGAQEAMTLLMPAKERAATIAASQHILLGLDATQDGEVEEWRRVA
jgi:hypothetical protein